MVLASASRRLQRLNSSLRTQTMKDIVAICLASIIFGSLFSLEVCKSCGLASIDLKLIQAITIIPSSLISIPILFRFVGRYTVLLIATIVSLILGLLQTVMFDLVDNVEPLCSLSLLLMILTACLGGPLWILHCINNAAVHQRSGLVCLFGITFTFTLSLIKSPRIMFTLDPVRKGWPFVHLLLLIQAALGVLVYYQHNSGAKVAISCEGTKDSRRGASSTMSADAEQDIVDESEDEKKKEKKRGREQTRGALWNAFKNCLLLPSKSNFRKLFSLFIQPEDLVDLQKERLGGGFAPVESLYRLRQPRLYLIVILAVLFIGSIAISISCFTLLAVGSTGVYKEIRDQDMLLLLFGGITCTLIAVTKFQYRQAFIAAFSAAALLSCSAVLAAFLPIPFFLLLQMLSVAFGAYLIALTASILIDLLPKKGLLFFGGIIFFFGVLFGVLSCNKLWEKEKRTSWASSYVYGPPGLAWDSSAMPPTEDQVDSSFLSQRKDGGVLFGREALEYSLSKINITDIAPTAPTIADVMLDPLRPTVGSDSVSRMYKNPANPEVTCFLELTPSRVAKGFSTLEDIRGYFYALRAALAVQEEREKAGLPSLSVYVYMQSPEKEAEDGLLPLGSRSPAKGTLARNTPMGRLLLADSTDETMQFLLEKQNSKEAQRDATRSPLSSTFSRTVMDGDQGWSEGVGRLTRRWLQGRDFGGGDKVTLEEILNDADLAPEQVKKLKAAIAIDAQGEFVSNNDGDRGSDKAPSGDDSSGKRQEALLAASICADPQRKASMYSEEHRRQLIELVTSNPCPTQCCLELNAGTAEWQKHISPNRGTKHPFALMLLLSLLELAEMNSTSEAGYHHSTWVAGPSIREEVFRSALTLLSGDLGPVSNVIGLSRFLEQSALPHPSIILTFCLLQVAAVVVLAGILLSLSALKIQRIEIVSL